MSFASLLQSNGRTVTIANRANTLDAGGSPVATYTNARTALCWVQPLSANEAAMYGAERGRNAYRLFFLAGTTIVNTDRVTCSINSETRTLDVLGVELPGEMAGGPMQRVEATAQETLPRT
jgi:head-tail adaptor